MKPIRILMLFTVMNRGGAESMVMNYYRHIDRSKIQFDFIVHRKEKGAYDDEIESLGGKIYRMRKLNPLTFGLYQKEIKIFFDMHPEYKIIHGHCSESGYFIYKEAAKRKIPIIIAHGHNSHAMFDAKWFFRTYFKYAMRKYINTEFTCGKEAAIWLFGKNSASKAILQHNAINTSLFHFNYDLRVEKRKELRLPLDAQIIGNVGRFEKQKNHIFIIKIFSLLSEINPKAYLLLIGTGELKDQIKKEVIKRGISKKVIFLENRSDVASLLQTMDLLLFPSFMEGFSLSMVEAQSTGLPCLASDTIPQEIKMTDLVTFLSLDKSSEIWSRKAKELLEIKINRTPYSEQIKAAGYDIDSNAEWLQNKYIELLNER